MIIFTDLDGTLLDRADYSYGDAEPALKLLKAKGIPLIFCSSKTTAEQEALRKEMGLSHPFIVEDGGATFIEKDYFRFPYTHGRKLDNYHVIEYGTPYEEIRRILKLIVCEAGLEITGYGDMSVAQIVDKTGLNPKAAARAKTRQYQETIVNHMNTEEIRHLDQALDAYGLRLSRGTRFYGVMGNNDKGRAAVDLIELYRREYGEVLAVGIGDSGNDRPLLSVVDKPMLVRKSDSTWENINHPDLIRIDGIGPVGWNCGVIEMLSSTG